MSDMELSRLLSEFEESAKKLNAASDSINSIITDIEQKLVNANAGLEVWLDGLKDDYYLFETKPEAWSEDDGKEGYKWNQTLLGFTKLNQTEGWRLAFRERTVFQEGMEADEDELSINDGKIEALWKAPRNTRLKALELMPELVRRLHHDTEQALKAIDQAKKIAQAKKVTD
jgi:hypothetical protein